MDPSSPTGRTSPLLPQHPPDQGHSVSTGSSSRPRTPPDFLQSSISTLPATEAAPSASRPVRRPLNPNHPEVSEAQAHLKQVRNNALIRGAKCAGIFLGVTGVGVLLFFTLPVSLPVAGLILAGFVVGGGVAGTRAYTQLSQSPSALRDITLELIAKSAKIEHEGAENHQDDLQYLQKLASESLVTLEYQDSVHHERAFARMMLANLYLGGCVPGKDHKDAIALYSQLLRHYSKNPTAYSHVEAVLCGQLLRIDDCVDKKEPALGNKTPFERNIELMESGEAIAFRAFEALIPIARQYPEESQFGQAVRANAEKIVSVMERIIQTKHSKNPVKKISQFDLVLNFLRHFEDFVAKDFVAQKRCAEIIHLGTKGRQETMQLVKTLKLRQ